MVQKSLVLALGCLLVAFVGLRLPAQSFVRVSGGSGLSTEAPVAANDAKSVDQIIDRVIAREHEELQMLTTYRRVAETYVQELKPNRKEPLTLWRDYYYLGVTGPSKNPVDYHSMLLPKDQLPKQGFSDDNFIPQGFLEMAYVDRRDFDRRHYRFQYAGREFLGDVRCLVFEVTPLPKSGKARFLGRIWVEDQSYTVVRFNGSLSPIHEGPNYHCHFDSWRTNVKPGVWVPAVAFAEETNLKVQKVFSRYFRFRAQTRFWGYGQKITGRQQEFSDLTIDAPTPFRDDAADQDRDKSPVQAEREWKRQAQGYVLEAMERASLLSPPGEIDKLLNTVVNNLEVTNNLDLEPEVQCRVLTTSNLDSFTVGNTIVISRGLLDVLPDEATLAAVLAQELGAILVANSSPDQYGFADTIQIPPLRMFNRFSFKSSHLDQEEASNRALALLEKSPYRDKLSNAGLFLKQISSDSTILRALVDPHLGDGVYLASRIMNSAPPLQVTDRQQIAALPLGGRLKLDPWTGGVELLEVKPVVLASYREKMPLELAPFMPYLTRCKSEAETTKVQGVALFENQSASSSHADR
jgi:hypothetical protein